MWGPAVPRGAAGGLRFPASPWRPRGGARGEERRGQEARGGKGASVGDLTWAPEAGAKVGVGRGLGCC